MPRKELNTESKIRHSEGSLGVAHGVWHTLDDGSQDFGDACACLAACAEDFGAVAPDKVDNLVLDLLGVCAWHVDLVDDGYDGEVVVDGTGRGWRLSAAWMPWLASTTRSAPSQAAMERLTS